MHNALAAQRATGELPRRYGRMPKPNLSDNDLKQMDEAWQVAQPEPVVRGLLNRALEDLRAARDRLNQTPKNSSRPSGSMSPWQRGTGDASGGTMDDMLPGEQDEPPRQTDDTPAEPGAEPAAEHTSPDAPGPKAPDVPPDAAACVPAPAVPRGRPGRRVGAPGHGRQQKLVPTKTHEYRPLCCAACQRVLPTDGEAQAWTAWDMLEMLKLSQPQPSECGAPLSDPAETSEVGLRIEVTRYRLMQQRCVCGHITRAEAARAAEDAAWPGVPIGQQRLLGPQLASAVVWLCVRMRLSRRNVSELLLELFGLMLSPALVDQTVHQAARSVAPLEQALADELAKAKLVYADETSWSESGQKLWLWVICSCATVLYVIGSRGREMLDNVLALDFGGTLMSDGYAAYRNRLLRLRCWAHLHRKARGLAESTDRQVATAGAMMLQLVEDLMRAVFEARESQGPPPTVTHAAQIEQLRQLCERHRDASPKALRELAREFLNDWEAIVRPLADPRLPLTNNAAERQLRHFVIARRISYGTRTEVGSHSVALLASIIDTCRLRRASATDLLARAIHAARMGLPTPCLPAIPADLLTADAALAMG
jgi:transposase